MTRKKNPLAIKARHGLAGPKTVGPSSVTFDLPGGGGTATAWFENVHADNISVKNLQADTGVITDLDSTTFTVETIEANISVDTDIINARIVNVSEEVETDILEARIVRASEKVETPLIEGPATGTLEIVADTLEIDADTLEIDADTEVTGDLEVGGHADIGGNVEVGNTMTASLVRAKNDVALYDEAEGTEHRHLSSMLQRFPNLSQAYRGTEEGEVFVIEPALEGRQTYDCDVLPAIGYGRAIATDGRYVFVVATTTETPEPGSEVKAYAIDTETQVIARSYVLTHPEFSEATNSFGVVTNGERVAFVYKRYAEIFDIEDGSDSVFLYNYLNTEHSDGYGLSNVWADNRYIFISHTHSGGPVITRVSFNEDSMARESPRAHIIGNGTSYVGGCKGFPIRGVSPTDLSWRGDSTEIYAERFWTDGTLIYYTRILGTGSLLLNAIPFPDTSDRYLPGNAIQNVFRDRSFSQGIEKIVFDSHASFIQTGDFNVYHVQRPAINDTYSYTQIGWKIQDEFPGAFVRDIACDGQYLYVLTTDNTKGPAKFYLNNPPSLFKRIAPSEPGGRILYQTMVPLEENAYPLKNTYMGVSDLAVGRVEVGGDIDIAGGMSVTGRLQAPTVPIAIGRFIVDDPAEGFESMGTSVNIEFKDQTGNTYNFNIPEYDFSSSLQAKVEIRGGQWLAGGGLIAPREITVDIAHGTGEIGLGFQNTSYEIDGTDIVPVYRTVSPMGLAEIFIVVYEISP